MASSLKDLLAEDGFKGKKSLLRSRTSVKSESPFSERTRTARSRSDVSRHATHRDSPMKKPSLLRRETTTTHEIVEDENDKITHKNDTKTKNRGYSSIGRRSFSEKPVKPLLDEAAIEAIVSILICHVTRFLRDAEFRSSLREKCVAVLEMELGDVAKLGDAMGAVERVAEESASKRDLKKAVLQLNVVVGLNEDGSKDGIAYGIPDRRLSACAHFYLSIAYKLQSRDRSAAAHLLQVFCDSPSLARTTLLPELWENLFLPQLSHVKEWRDQELESLTSTPRNPTKLEHLAEAYDEIADTGTLRFAAYYKAWLAGSGAESVPPVPSVRVPSASARETPKRSVFRSRTSSEMSSSPGDPFSPQLQPTVSEKLYNAVFRHSSKSSESPRERFRDDQERDKALYDHVNGNMGMIVISRPRIVEDVKSDFESQPPENEEIEGRLSPAVLNEELLYLEGKSPSLSSIPQDFICPLTGRIFEDPVTLETGQTFERKAIKAWFDQGNATCPATAKSLECKQLIPSTNMVLKRVIETWKSQNWPALSLDLLLQRAESGDLDERTRVASQLIRCIEADSDCRNLIARKIDRKCLTEMLFSKQSQAIESAVLLLVELICLNRKKVVIELLSELKSEEEGLEKTMHIVLIHLQSSSPHHKPLVAVLLLHFHLLVEPRKYSIYREEAVDALTEALNGGLKNRKICVNICRALLILGGRFSSSGKLLTVSWILNQAGFETDSNEASSADGDEQENEQWQRNMCALLLGNGKRSLLEAISKCIGSGEDDLATACLATAAWLSSAIGSPRGAELQLRALSLLIARLNDCLENAHCVEHKVLASTSLLNFSKISECRTLLMSMADNMSFPLRSLVEVTWTARQLSAIIFEEEF